ncbi:MAG: sigma-54-dependent Fis family transcriptional regulator [Oceanospirillaceae bacterium]|nr:sigma-54-dependent Fis family transcriptional regulator [Oceanospirillaceae bacterium]
MTVILAMIPLVRNKVILVDDNEARRLSIANSLDFLNVRHEVLTFVELLQSKGNGNRYSIALIGDCSLPLSLNKLIQFIRDNFHNTPICLLQSWNDSEKLTQSSQKQLLRVLTDKLNDDILTDLLHEAQIYKAVRSDSKAGQNYLFPLLIGESVAIETLKKSMSKVVDREVNVLITGESGTGKELVARSLHDLSTRAKQPFVPVNCGAIPEELLESELFGHEKGAFTGAVSSRAGRFEMANNGTLFLDEIGDMPLPMQVKMLRVLEERCFQRVGGSKTIHVNVRIVAATHRNLEEMVASGAFREDLFYRLNVYPIDVPSLRERKSDITILLQHFVERACEQDLGKLKFKLSAIDSLERHPWSGNVRELSNLIERLSIMYPDGVIGVSELPLKCRHVNEPDPSRYQVQSDMHLETDNHFISVLEEAEQEILLPGLELPERDFDLKGYVEQVETSLIKQALAKSNQVVARAATLLSIRRTTLVEKMRKYGIQRQ